MKKVLLLTLSLAAVFCLASCASLFIEDDYYYVGPSPIPVTPVEPVYPPYPDPYNPIYPYYPDPYDPYYPYYPDPYIPDPYYPVIGSPCRVESTGLFRDELVLNITSGQIRSKGYRDGDRIRLVIGNAGEFTMPVYVQRTNNTYHSMGMHISVFDTERAVIRYTGGCIAELLGIRPGDVVYIL